MSNRSLPSQLLNMLAPDIRSSLGELQGTLQLVAHDLAAKQDHDSVSQRRMELVKNASNRVSEFTNMLSIVTKLDALSQGDLKQQPERVDLLRLFDQLAHRINGQCTDAQVHLDVRFDPPDHDRLQGLHVDAANLTQLVGNILRFSWATTQQKMVSIEISLTADDLRLAIADNGLSMSDRELPSIGDSLRLIAHTGHSSEAEQQACREAGFDDFLSKPVDKDSLKLCLQRAPGVSGLDRPFLQVNLPALEDLQNLVGDEAMARLLAQFMVELDERMQVVASLESSNPDDVNHNLHMMRYSAEHFGFEQLAQCARDMSQIRMSIDDVVINHSDPETPALVCPSVSNWPS